MQEGWVKIRHFGRKTRDNSKTVQDRRIVSIKVEQEVEFALSNGYVSDDLGWPLTPHVELLAASLKCVNWPRTVYYVYRILVDDDVCFAIRLP